MKRSVFAYAFAATTLVSAPAWADKITVFPFTSPNNTSPPEINAAREWTLHAVQKTGNTFASPDEMVQAMAAVRDGVPDTSSEYIAAGKATQSQWTLAGHVSKDDLPPSILPDGSTESGYTLYRIELEACQVGTGRVESLSREVVDGAESDIAEMIALLIRPEGIANADIPWEHPGTARPKPPKPVPRPPPPQPTPPPEPVAKTTPDKAYGSGHAFALGAGIGVNGVFASPSTTRGSSLAAPLSLVVAYALPDAAPGLEIRGYFAGNAAGPSAYTIDAGARYAFAPIQGVPFYVGPEAVLGAFITEGAEKTGRFYIDASAFIAYQIWQGVWQFELAGDIGGALGGSASLGLAGGTFRSVIRF